MGFPVSPIVANLYMEYLEQKFLVLPPDPQGFGTGMCMTHGSSIRNQQTRLPSTHHQC